MRRFEHEARAASALNHPNVATIYEIGDADGRRFIAMEYVAGETLAARIARQPLELTDVLELALQIAAALEEAHGKAIIHRDIKPANVMLTPHGRIKVLDFGLAKVRSAEQEQRPGTVTGTTPGLVMGTAQYHEPGAGSWRRGRPPQRHLFLRRRVVRDGDRPGGVQGSIAGRDHERRHQRAAHARP